MIGTASIRLAMDSPLLGFAWNRLETASNFEAGIFTVIARDHVGEFHAVGTGFIVSTAPSEGRSLGVTAAHVLDEVRRLQRGPHDRSHPSTPPEFRPAERPIDLSLEGLLIVATIEGQHACFEVEGLAFDAAADIGLLALKPQTKRETRDVPREFAVDQGLPEVGQFVGVATYADLKCETPAPGRFTLTRSPVVRIGRVLSVFPDGQRLCRGPCFETSIPLFSGMSGGAVFLWGDEGPVRAMGLVCCDPDLDGPQKDDRAHEGRSLIAQLPVTDLGPAQGGARRVEFRFLISAHVGVFPTVTYAPVTS